jgi:hypothetical protein
MNPHTCVPILKSSLLSPQGSIWYCWTRIPPRLCPDLRGEVLGRASNSRSFKPGPSSNKFSHPPCSQLILLPWTEQIPQSEG